MTAADTAAALARALDVSEPLALLRHLGDDDVFGRGDVMFVVPGLWTGMPPRLLTAVRARRRSTFAGTCPLCGAVMGVHDRQMRHENDCDVRDSRIGPMLAEWYRRVGSFARGSRIAEDPLAEAVR